ncbi:hypothetical protein LIER_35510 [Lithospermum erythrorhizon]|uniref:HMG box domain-containing protein n=1 Tax=Lithospermum erythrorhizon TaxID=34254 RepID=A0AAV3NVN4_LITER
MFTIAQAPIVSNPIPTKKARSRKALKPKDSSTDEANILAGSIPESSPVMPPPEDSVEKENHESLSKNKAKKVTKKGVKAKQSHDDAMEKELLALQEKLQKMTIEKEQTEEMLKEKDLELKKLQKAKEFKPILTIPSLQSVKEKEKKKKKGNHSVKKPSPAYVLWCKDQWTEVKKSNPEADFKEVSTLLGAKWKTISAEEKKPYEQKYQAEKEAYLKIVGNEKREHEAMKLLEDEQKQKTAMELLQQYTQFVQETEKAIKKSKKIKDESKPKHPISAFFVFSNERRASLFSECNNVKEFAKIAGEEWRNMTEEQKAPYEEIAMKNKEQYVEDMKVYKQKKEEEEANLKKEEEQLMKLQKLEAMQLLTKKEKTEILIKKTKENTKKAKKEKKNDDPNKPKRPASSFILFSKEERKNVCDERPEINNSTVNALISVKWKELSEEEKQKWNAKAAVAMEAYKKELEEYNKSAAAAESSEGSN